MANRSKTIILNDYSDMKTGRGNRSGAKVSLEIKAEPLVHVFDEVALGSGPGEAIRNLIQKEIETIVTPAKSSTVARRKSSREALASGQASAETRAQYRNGPPVIGAHRMFNSSGRLAKGLAVRQQSGEWQTTAPPGRIQGDTADLLEKLVDHIPVLRDAKKLLSDPAVAKSVEKTLDQMILKARDERGAKTAALRLAKLNAAKRLVGIVRTFA